MADRLPSLTPKRVVVAFEKASLRIVREGRNHTVLWREGLPRPVAVPRHAREVKRGLLADLIKQAHLTHEEFRKHLS